MLTLFRLFYLYTISILDQRIPRAFSPTSLCFHSPLKRLTTDVS
ncbi:hypothetical protein SBA4_2930028 [Candidatus Sulfopaludibacter sp. SbA4]|nr:hypothetical protein SBA4_2930028 [Candidatus Sulfopaludibacter sp. SbA4]